MILWWQIQLDTCTIMKSCYFCHPIIGSLLQVQNLCYVSTHRTIVRKNVVMQSYSSSVEILKWINIGGAVFCLMNSMECFHHLILYDDCYIFNLVPHIVIYFLFVSVNIPLFLVMIKCLKHYLCSFSMFLVENCVLVNGNLWFKKW